MNPTAPSKDSAWSSLREEYVEYAFLGELCREFWRRDLAVDVLRSHTDHSGFDIVLEAGRFCRHVQLKSSFVGSATRQLSINLKLGEKAGGCVVLILFERASLKIEQFRWFGSSDPAAPMPSLGERPVKHVKGNAMGVKSVRPGHRALVRTDFQSVATIEDLGSLLFPDTTPVTRENPLA